MYSMGGQSRSMGLGAAAARQAQCGVYVTGLPPTTTQAQLEQLFSAHGPIRRVKVYMEDGDKDASTRCKGDALVTYVKPSSVDTAVPRLNGHQVAPGFTIKVTQADFSHKEGGRDSGGRDEGGPALPEQCCAEQYPVVILHNVYTAEEVTENPDGFYSELEADMLGECARFGTVRCVVTLEGEYEGSVAITFADSAGARECAKTMHGRFFDGRQIEVDIVGKFEGGAEGSVGQLLLPLGDQVDAEHRDAAGTSAAAATAAAAPVESAAPAAAAAPEPEPPVEEIPTDLDSFLSSV
ncbi:hypothetical protein JKP88DRAFT_202244 [Tribonema minus]|uniref:RRM domain-containing protein n=1 Tax=Tribonema minus TaxID=303371 RepID=A0A835YW78_9STRA|nr:hypothetical protein JKP88DRAFT_202244 [Tribonema minus]